MKIAVIGGGSTYTPELVEGLLQRRAQGAMPLSRLVLQDPDPSRRAPVARFCRQMAQHRPAPAGGPLEIDDTGELDAALEGADFVIVQLRVGGQEQRHADIQMGLELGLIGQETTGVGGFAKALRTIPAALEIARRVRELAPEAWLINFTNPSGMVTEALLRFGGHERVVGLCNVPIEMRMEIAKALGEDADAVRLDWVGLNHLGWVRAVHVDSEAGSQDLLPAILERIEASRGQLGGPANLAEIDYPPGFLRALGMLPSSYVRFFYAGDEMLRQIREAPETRAQTVLRLERELFAIYAEADGRALPAQLSQRGGAWYSRLAVEVIEALGDSVGKTLIVNTTNRGAVPDLPDDAVVEVPCSVSRAGVLPSPRGAVEESILGLIRQTKSYERLAIDAALAQDGPTRRRLAWLALVANPLVANVSLAGAVLDALRERGHLDPQETTDE